MHPIIPHQSDTKSERSVFYYYVSSRSVAKGNSVNIPKPGLDDPTLTLLSCLASQQSSPHYYPRRGVSVLVIIRPTEHGIVRTRLLNVRSHSIFYVELRRESPGGLL